MDFKSLLAKYQYTQSAFAQEFNIPLRTVESWATNKRTPPTYVLDMIIKILALTKPDVK